MMRAMRALLALPVLLALVASPALAQKPRSFTRPEPVAEPRAAGQPARDDAIAPEIREELDLERTLPYLAYTLGELHYLAFACSGPDDQQWREQMVELLAMEAADDRRWRDRLIEGFNDGYRAQQRYRTRCGLEADAERRALAHRGRDLSEMMRSAYFD
ncbi:uncharacterized protein (TIGR02301 family) [Maricaulis maris]|uniref:Uncharacterized protein (TIGR02301 family) n=2 Tax=Maricaulis maris TaxID=74318 RepID=A0A495D2I4_9PROT|nr:uncharacterized protein (TIGR02301 family) [Maricaulis maris]